MIEQDSDNSYTGTKESIEYRLKRGLVKKCPSCTKTIGSSWKRCGECISNQRAAENLKFIRDKGLFREAGDKLG